MWKVRGNKQIRNILVKYMYVYTLNDVMYQDYHDYILLAIAECFSVMYTTAKL